MASIEGVGADPDGGQPRLYFPTFTVLSAASHASCPRERMSFRRWVVMEGVFSHIGLHIDDVLHAFVFPVRGPHHEEDKSLRSRPSSPGWTPGPPVGVADVVLPAVGPVRPVSLGDQLHFRGINIGTVFLFGKPEGKDAPLPQEAGGPFLHFFIVAHPDRPEAQDGDLPGVPVVEGVKGQDLVELAVAPGVQR